MMKIVLYVLAAIGTLALVAILGMFLMHGTMMSGTMQHDPSAGSLGPLKTPGATAFTA